MKRLFLTYVIGLLSFSTLLVSQTALADPAHFACKDGSVQYATKPNESSSEACQGFGGVETDSTNLDNTLKNPTNPVTDSGKSCGGVATSIDYGCGSAKGGAIYGFLRGIIKFAGGLVGLLVIMMLIVGGIRYITSAGNPKLVAAAKNQIVNAIIGLVLFALMLAILNFLLPGGIIG